MDRGPEKRFSDGDYVRFIHDLAEARHGQKTELTALGAARFGISARTIRRDVRKARNRVQDEESGHSHRLPADLESLIAQALDHFLMLNRPKPQTSWGYLKDLCSAAGIKPCSRSTWYNRLKQIPLDVRKVKRREPNLESIKVRTVRGKSTYARAPLVRVQIDHTPLDCISVDSETRKPIGRPTLTICVDDYTGCVLGLYLGLEAPSRVSIAECLVHAAQPKEAWLESLGVKDGVWPMYGLPDVVYTDNASEFRSADVSAGYRKLGMEPPTFRPPRKPKYGARVERLFRTINAAIDGLGGYVGNSVADRTGRNAEGSANKTIGELTALIAEYIACEYHPKALTKAAAPADLWEAALKNPPPSMTKRIPPDAAKVFRAMLPRRCLTIQGEGVVWDGEKFCSPVFDEFLRHPDMNYRKQWFRLDPRDVNQIYLEHPERDGFISIPNIKPAPTPTPLEVRKKQRAEVRRRDSRPDQIQRENASRRRRREIEEKATQSTRESRRERRRAEATEQYARSATSKLTAESGPSPVKQEPTPKRNKRYNVPQYDMLDPGELP